METTPKPSLLLRTARRIGIGVVGWLYALPFVLAGPLIFWLAFSQSQGDNAPHDLGSHAQIVFWFGSAHAVVFLILGLPLFLVFWGRRSLIWYLPNSLLIGFLLRAGSGFPHYYSSPRFYDQMFLLSAGYGITTAFGCWLANWISRKQVRIMKRVSVSLRPPPKSSFTYRFTKRP